MHAMTYVEVCDLRVGDCHERDVKRIGCIVCRHCTRSLTLRVTLRLHNNMALITLKPALLVAVVALLSYDAEGFTAPLRPTTPQLKSATSLNGFFMSEDEKKEETPASAPAPVPKSEKEPSLDKFQMTSARKEVVFDEKSGRFFETNRDAADCIPEEEYCQIDESTGDMIRLTVAEKERIFIDALQVC